MAVQWGFNGVCVYIYITGHSRISWDLRGFSGILFDSTGHTTGCFTGFHGIHTNIMWMFSWQQI